MRDAILAAGYPLELRAHGILEKAGFQVGYGERYQTDPDGTHHEIDLVATSYTDKATTGQLRHFFTVVLLVAVKHYPAGGAFVGFDRSARSSDRPIFPRHALISGLPSYGIIADPDLWPKPIDEVDEELERLDLVGTPCVQYAVVQNRERKYPIASHEPETEKDFQQLIGAMSHEHLAFTKRLLANDKFTSVAMKLIVPVLVLGCPLYTFSVRTGKLARKKWFGLRLIRDIPKPGASSVIDVVDVTALRPYAEHIRRAHKTLVDTALQHNNRLIHAGSMQQAAYNRRKPGTRNWFLWGDSPEQARR